MRLRKLLTRALLGILATTISITFVACGHYAPPQPPERFAPAAVRDIQVIPQENGITLQWRSPEQNLQGRALEDLAFFDIRRADLKDLAQFIKAPIESSISVGKVADKAITDFVTRRSVAQVNKTPLRREKIDPELIQYLFSDTSPVEGEIYVYSIVPMTRKEVPGKVDQYIKVQYRGLNTLITLLDSSIFDRPYALGFSSDTLSKDE
ncbi:MAG: hypothetical protein ACO3XO_02985 [Bdellovibrionota bacterium]